MREVAGSRAEVESSKIVLLQSKVSFLGHVVDNEGVHIDPKKVESIQNYPTPDNGKYLRTFLGMASFYRRFCLGFSKWASPLFSLTSPKSVWK